jgi:transposase-like protein
MLAIMHSICQIRGMANNLPLEKKVAVISMLCEGSSIRGIERITGVNRNTIMNLAVRIGTAC